MATTTATPANACGVDRFKAAIFEQKPLIEFEVNENLANRPRYLIQKIADGGEMDPHDNGETLKMRRGFQAPVGYQEVDNSVRPLIEGEQTAQAPCSNASATFGTMINEVDPNACEGVCIVDFAQGFSFEGSQDFELKLGTPIRCIEELARMERRFVAQFLEQEVDSFTDTAFESFDHHLIRTAIERGGANASVKSVNVQPLPVLTEGGWDGPPTHPVSIYFLEHYRRQIIQRLKSAGKLGDTDNFVLEVEMTRGAWRRAKIAEHLERTGAGGYIPGAGDHIRIDDSIFKEGGLMGRAFELWEGKIRVVFNETPIRGFFKPTGSGPDCDQSWTFIRIHHLTNEVNEAAGTSGVYNPAYDYTTVCCDGVDYRVVELIPHIHQDSFKRYGLTKAIGPDGVEAQGNTFQVRLLKDADLSSKECPNDFGTYYTYRARHNFRWRDIYPEFSGFIAHVHTILGGYDIAVDNEVLKVTTGNACATPEVLDNCNERGCFDENCPEPACDPADNTTSLSPCGSLLVGYRGEPSLTTLVVDRSDYCDSVSAEVSYEAIDGTAIYGTHYQFVDPDGNALPATGTLTWPAGESGEQQLCVQILAALPDTPAPDPEGPCCEETEATPNDATFSVEIKNAAGTTLDDCTVADVSIRNREVGSVGATQFDA